MKANRNQLLALIIILLSFLLAIIFYHQLPATVATHWDYRGNANGYSNKFWGTLLLPFMMLVLYGVFLLLPKIDPKRHNIERFYQHFERFIVILFLFLLYLQILTLRWNLGNHFAFIKFLIPGFSVLCWGIADLVAHAQPNWTIGIRTPWTLEDETVWKQTHEFSARLFRLAAVPILGALLWPNAALLFVLIPFLLAALLPALYSFRLYRQRHPAGQSQD